MYSITYINSIMQLSLNDYWLKLLSSVHLFAELSFEQF